MKNDKIEYYSSKNIRSHNADYNIIYGERSNGKTTDILWLGLDDFIKTDGKNQMALIRRYEEDFRGAKGTTMFEGITNLGWIKEATHDEYNAVYYYSQRWYLCKYDDTGTRTALNETPFAYGFAISSEEHYKSTSYPNIKTILFDEFITRTYYLPDEFVKFQNLLSTIIRLRTDVKIYMCGNSINKFCPYFNEMGLTGIKKQARGTIDIYTYGESELKVAVEYSDFPSKKKASNKYFAFNNPKLKMITTGGWEIDLYPHLPHKYIPKDVIEFYFLIFDGEMLQGNIIEIDNNLFIYYHRKTTPIREDNDKLVYQQQTDYRENYRVNIMKPYRTLDKLITSLMMRNKVFYQDNEVGEIVNNYIKWCKINA